MSSSRVMRRPKEGRVFAGVCAALANFFGISVFWVRLAFVIALIPGGVPGVLIYLLGWLIIPSD